MSIESPPPELETKAGCSFTAENLEQYLTRVSDLRGKQEAKDLATYVFIVRCKYLHLLTAFYLYLNDTARVDNEFVAFEKDVETLKAIHRRVLSEEFAPEVRSAIREIKQHAGDHVDSGARKPTTATTVAEGASANNPPPALSQLSISGTAAPTDTQSEHQQLLIRAKLDSYFEVFMAKGADDLEYILDASEDELRDILRLVGMEAKPVHMLKFKKALKGWGAPQNADSSQSSSLRLKNVASQNRQREQGGGAGGKQSLVDLCNSVKQFINS